MGQKGSLLINVESENVESQKEGKLAKDRSGQS